MPVALLASCRWCRRFNLESEEDDEDDDVEDDIEDDVEDDDEEYAKPFLRFAKCGEIP